MVTLDDRLLGEKLQNYCSSSEDEDESPSKSDDENGSSNHQRSSQRPKYIPESELENYRAQSGFTENTGPKGVIKDWQRFKQLETEKRDDQEKEKLTLIKKLSMTCRSHLDEEAEKQKQAAIAEEDDEFFDAEDDLFINEYRAKLMLEIQNRIANAPRFGRVVHLTREDYTNAIDNENKNVTVVVHIYENSARGCKTMSKCFQILAEQYPLTKFCQIQASDAQLSRKFIENGCPTILVYRGRELVGNFVSLTNKFGDDFYPSDIESLLQEHGLLPTSEYFGSLRSTITNKQNDDDSDDD